MNRRPALSSSRRFRAEFKPRLGTARAHTRIGGELFFGARRERFKLWLQR